MAQSKGLFARIREMFSAEDSTGRSAAEQSVLHDLGYTVVWLAVLTALAAGALVALALPQSGWRLQLALVGLCGLVAIAAGAGGGALGFLFGIPRTLTTDGGDLAPDPAHPESRHTRSNTNLEQISDWLTKIVVGATLVQINTIWPGLVAFGRELEASVIRLPGLTTLTGFGGLVPVLVVIGFVAGFLTLYLQTRTFLAIMFARTEHVMSDPRLGLGDVDVLRQAVLRIAADGERASVPEQTRELARRALGGQTTATLDSEALRQRGFAQVVLGNLTEGATTLKRAYEATGDAELGRIAARLLARTSRPGEAKDLLGHVSLPTAGATLSEPDIDALLARMFANLYEPPPFGFNESLRIGDSLRHQPVVKASPRRGGRLALYTAAALGQCVKYGQGTKTADELDALRTRTLENVREALAFDPALRGSLRNMLVVTGEDDDLSVFKEDAEFWQVIDGAAP